MQEPSDSTRVMAAGQQGADPTIVASSRPPDASTTQMAPARVCPVCAATNAGLEQYCSECGFLLNSTPGQAGAAPEEAATQFELVDAGGRRFPLHEGDNTVGREAADVLLMDPTVSRRHAVVRVQNECVAVMDLGSTNGTAVDGGPAPRDEPVEAASGASLRFGVVTLTLVGPVDATAASSARTVVDAPPGSLLAEGTGMAGAPACLQPIGGGGPYALGGKATTIGRRAGNDLTLGGDPYLSGRHAIVACTDGVWTITDLGSTNGTTVNGLRLAPDMPQGLVPGDEVGLGHGVYRFEVAAPAPEEAQVAPADEDESAASGDRSAVLCGGAADEPVRTDEP